MIITNLESHIAKDGMHAIFTGTFNPPHIGHTTAIKEALRQLPYLASVVALPHIWNTHKDPPVEMDIRVRWLAETFKEFIPEIESKTVVCFDPLIYDKPERFDDLCNTYKFRIHRIVGSDKHSVLIRSKNDAKVLLSPRDGQINSTIIRKSIKESNINRIREMLSETVLDDILANRYFG
jgi:cytidyltransferase-like protein